MNYSSLNDHSVEANQSEKLTESESEEEELPPPEDQNDARELNVGNILMVGVVVILVIFFIAFIALNANGKKKKQQGESELDKAGSKTVIEFREKGLVEQYSTNSGADEADKGTLITDVEADLDFDDGDLPENLQLFPSQGEVGTAPVHTAAATSKSSAYISSRPDTKNSKSTRKIEGLAALDYSSQMSSSNLVSQIMSGNYSVSSVGQSMTREEYIAQQMAQTQSLQNQLTGNASTATSRSGYDKQDFFTNGSGTGGNGSYLGKAALWDGTIISGALVTAIDTDNPGVVIARVTENVYSSQDHSYLLIPEGSLLMATYNSSISYGQRKVQVAWNLLIRPDNYRMQLGNMNGVNVQGASGYEGAVSNHPFETMKALGMVAVYSVIQTEVASQIRTQNNEYLQNAMTDVYAEVSELGNKIVNKALDIQPTIRIKEGTEIKLITNTPLELPPVEMNRPEQAYVRTR